jgi:hypothetical protein
MSNDEKLAQWLSARHTRNPILEIMRDSFDGGDAWGSVMEWWFAIADYLTDLDPDSVPQDWQFRQSPIGSDVDSYAYQMLANEQPTAEQLIHAGNVLSRYAAQLKLAGMDY